MTMFTFETHLRKTSCKKGVLANLEIGSPVFQFLRNQYINW